MKVQIENPNNIGSENVFITNGKWDLCGWYGLTYFELSIENVIFSLNKEDIYKLKETVDTMIEKVRELE